MVSKIDNGTYTVHTGKHMDNVDGRYARGGMSHATVWIPVQAITLDGTTPPTATTVGTSAQSQSRVLQFDDTTSDDVFIDFLVPNDYGSELKMVIPYSCTDATTTTAIVWAADSVAIATDGTVVTDAAGTACTPVGQVLDGTASFVQRVVLDLGANDTTLAPGRLCKIHLWRDHDHTAGGDAGIADDATADAVLQGGVELIYRVK